MGLCAKERRGKNLVLKHVRARNVTGSKVFQVWSFEFPYRVFWTRINPGLVPFYRDPRYLDRSSQFSHPTQHFPGTKPSSQFVSSFDRSGRSSQSRDYISNTEILPFIQQRDIADIKLGANRDSDTTLRKKSLFTQSPPSVSVSVAQLLCKVALLLLFIINFTVEESSSS